MPGNAVALERDALVALALADPDEWVAMRELYEPGIFGPQLRAAAEAIVALRHEGSEVNPRSVSSVLERAGNLAAARAFQGVIAQARVIGDGVAVLRLLADQAKVDENGAPEIPLVRACDAVEKPVEWVIENFLARGELTDLSGDPGVGKGGITASWAARITRENPTATVIFFATEDPLGRVKARLRAEGADLSRVFLLDITKPNASPILPADVAQVEALVRKHNAALLVLDPALEFMEAELDSHKQQDVARFMAPLLSVAMRTGAALLTVRHNNKNAGASALHRASGSIGFTGKVRIALTAAKNQETGQRALAMTKNNLGQDRLTIGYDVVSKDGASVIVWGETLQTSADELVNQEPGKKRGPPAAKLEAATDLLRDMLAAGPMRVDDVLRCAKSAGISRSRIYLAKDALRVRKLTVELASAWALPENETRDGL